MLSINLLAALNAVNFFGGMNVIRKIAVVVLVVLVITVLAACGGGAKDGRTLEDFKSAYVDAGHSLKDESAPLFQMINAKDGILFYVDNHIVKIYEYSDEKALDDAIKSNAMLKDFARNGKFLCEGSDDALIEIFAAVKK